MTTYLNDSEGKLVYVLYANQTSVNNTPWFPAIIKKIRPNGNVDVVWKGGDEDGNITNNINIRYIFPYYHFVYLDNILRIESANTIVTSPHCAPTQTVEHKVSTLRQQVEELYETMAIVKNDIKLLLENNGQVLGRLSSINTSFSGFSDVSWDSPPGGFLPHGKAPRDGVSKKLAMKNGTMKTPSPSSSVSSIQTPESEKVEPIFAAGTRLKRKRSVISVSSSAETESDVSINDSAETSVDKDKRPSSSRALLPLKLRRREI